MIEGNWLLAKMITDLKFKELRKEADNDRLAEIAWQQDSPRQSVLSHLLINLGEMIIDLGMNIQKQHERTAGTYRTDPMKDCATC